MNTEYFRFLYIYYIFKKYFLFFLSFFILNYSVYSQEDVRIILTTSSVTETLTLKKTAQILLIDEEKIKNSGANSLPELLKYILNIDVQERSPYGVQADISIRGSTFQQTLILIDGMRFNNSQTGHHNIDIPLTLNDIEKIEVLYGQGASVYGPDAFSGVINIITKKPYDREFSGTVKIAQFNTQIFSLSLDKKWGKFSHKISVEKKKSDGFSYDTDFDIFTFFSSLNCQINNGNMNLTAGFTDKEFGAYDFYTPGKNYPSKEWTDSSFGKFEVSYTIKNINIKPEIFFKNHKDRFILDITKPDWYMNNHLTYFYGGKVQVDIPSGKNGNFLAGIESVRDEIKSSNLGEHIRHNFALFFNYKCNISVKSGFLTGLRIDKINNEEQLSPELGINYRINKFLNFRTSIGRSFRSPTFTELYYRDPVNEGNSQLKPETAILFETGIDFIKNSNLDLSITLFNRDQRNLIDWVGQTEKGPWKAENIGKVYIYGIETGLKYKFSLFNSYFNFSRMNSETTKKYYSKYCLRYPENQFSFELSKDFKKDIFILLKVIYKERINEKGYSIVNGRFTKNIKNIYIFIEGNNLLDIKYEEIKGIPQPGRYISAGFSFKL